MRRQRERKTSSECHLKFDEEVIMKKRMTSPLEPDEDLEAKREGMTSSESLLEFDEELIKEEND